MVMVILGNAARIQNHGMLEDSVAIGNAPQRGLGSTQQHGTLWELSCMPHCFTKIEIFFASRFYKIQNLLCSKWTLTDGHNISVLHPHGFWNQFWKTHIHPTVDPFSVPKLTRMSPKQHMNMQFAVCFKHTPLPQKAQKTPNLTLVVPPRAVPPEASKLPLRGGLCQGSMGSKCSLEHIEDINAKRNGFNRRCKAMVQSTADRVTA